MSYRATIIERSAVQVAAVQAAAFPAGIPRAWQRLESIYPPVSGRRFYGLTRFEEASLSYYAAVETTDSADHIPHDFERLLLCEGQHARVKVAGWRARTSEFSTIFDWLTEQYDMPSGGFCIEFYRSQREAHLMIPIEDRGSARAR